MRPIEDQTPNARTWREIPQPLRPRAMSREGRRRFVRAGLRTVGIAGLALAAVWGVIEVAGIWQAEPRRIARAVGTAFVSRIELHTDGRVDQAWVERTLALPKAITLMELDLPRLQQRLLQDAQVRSVVLSKTFPSTLTVTLTERLPVVRLRTDAARDLLVARDGAVFAGIGYDAAQMETLPWLAGARLVRQGDGFAPIEDMTTVADLLARACNEAPALYRTWQVVNVARLRSDGEIEVRSSEVEKITFSTALDFLTQIARLDYVQDSGRVPLKSVNLGLGAQVVVDYDAAAALGKRAAAAARPMDRPAAASAYRFVLPDTNLPSQHRTNRDL
ncbi:MAG TPA: FtsQ-type POTRA domain-containing protein [Opitutaceae bacterium]|nr:FtsQ-type POTRA domain-containing protein [Opitutaceae bacterium]